MGWFNKKQRVEEDIVYPEASTEVVVLKAAEKTPKKYRLVGEKEILPTENGKFQGYRIQALVDIPLHGVKAGDMGGYVTSEMVLSHEGSCWVGGDAMVSEYTDTSYYSFGEKPEREFCIKENALITDNAYVYGIIRGNAKISGNAYVNSHLGGNSVISDNAYMFNCSVSGSLILSGNARLSDVNVYCQGAEPIVIKDDITIKGGGDEKTRIFCPAGSKISLSGASSMNKVSIDGGLIFDAVGNLESVTFEGDNTILGKPQIKPNVKFTGRNVISGDSLIPPGSHVHDVVMDSGVLQYGSPSALPELPAGANRLEIAASPVEAIDITEHLETIQQIEAEYESYTTDIVKLIKYPAMVDASLPEIADLVSKLRTAKRVMKSGNAKKVRDIAEALDLAFIRAENKVQTLVASHLDEGKKKSLKDAEKMFKLACDEASPEPEKRLGFKAGMRALEGIVPVSEKASDNMKARIGLLELEA